MKRNVLMLRIAGSICLLFMLFHFAFFKMLDWEHTLSCLSQNNRSILLTYHYISILITGFMGIIPLLQPKALLTSSLKYSILSMFCLFFVIRIITEFTLFAQTRGPSPVILVMCALPVLLFSLPMFNKSKQLREQKIQMSQNENTQKNNEWHINPDNRDYAYPVCFVDRWVW